VTQGELAPDVLPTTPADAKKAEEKSRGSKIERDLTGEVSNLGAKQTGLISDVRGSA
jgi:hypothetical protein